eukprot:ctg_1101.g362
MTSGSSRPPLPSTHALLQAPAAAAAAETSAATTALPHTTTAYLEAARTRAQTMQTYLYHEAHGQWFDFDAESNMPTLRTAGGVQRCRPRRADHARVRSGGARGRRRHARRRLGPTVGLPECLASGAAVVAGGAPTDRTALGRAGGGVPGGQVAHADRHCLSEHRLRRLAQDRHHVRTIRRA